MFFVTEIQLKELFCNIPEIISNNFSLPKVFVSVFIKNKTCIPLSTENERLVL